MNRSTPVHLSMFGLNPVVKFGSDRLKDEFLPRAAAGTGASNGKSGGSKGRGKNG